MQAESASADRDLEPKRNTAAAPVRQAEAAESGPAAVLGAQALAYAPRLAATSARPAVMRRAQQAFGNRAAQQIAATVQRKARSVQRHCACGGTCTTCSAVPAQRRPVQLQRREGEESEPEDAVVPQNSSGEPLDEATRETMEERFGADFGDVRVHTDRQASEAAERMRADAFTSGRDIYFAAGRYAPQSSEGQRLLAHELTHTEQQKDGASPQNVAAHTRDGAAIGAHDDPLEGEADRAADSVSRGERVAPLSSDASGSIRRNRFTRAVGAAWSATGGRAVSYVGGKIEEGAEALREWAIEQIEHYAPGLLEFVRDPIEFLRTRIESAVDSVFGGLMGRIEREGFFGALASIASDLYGSLSRGLGALTARTCNAVASAAQAIFDVARAIGGGAFDALRRGASAVADFFSGLWNDYGAPAWQAIRRFAGGVWDWITEKARWIWAQTEPIRSALTRAWNWLKRQFNLAWDTGAGVLDWIREKASRAWDRVKETLRPVMGPIRIIIGIAILLSPIGPIVAIVAAAPYIWRAIQWLWNNWGSDILVRARRVLNDDILPALTAGLERVSGLLGTAVTWLREQLGALTGALGQLADALGITAFLAMARRAVVWVGDQVRRFATWATTQFMRLVDTARAILGRIWDFIRPVVVVVAKILIVAGNPWLLPILLSSWGWLLMPDCFKPPIIDFVLDVMIAVLGAMPDFRSFGETWATVKRMILDRMRALRRAPMEEKVRVSNHIANTIGGTEIDGYANLFAAARQAPSMFVGQAEEELIGMDLTQPLPFERRAEPPAPTADRITAIRRSADVMPSEVAAQGATGSAAVMMTHIPELDLDPTLMAALNLEDGESRDLGERNEPGRTLREVQEELQQPEEPQGGTAVLPESAAGVPSQPVGEGGTEEELTTDQQLERMLANQPPTPCNAPAPAEGPATSADIPEAARIGPLTQGQRAHYMWEQIKRGIRQWYECHKTAIWITIITSLVVLAVAAFFTGGAILEAVPVILEIIGAIMIGVAVVRSAVYLFEYVGKCITGDVPGAARALARAFAVAAIELVFALLFNIGAVIKSIKAGATASLRAATRAAAESVTGIGRNIQRLGQIGLKAGARATTRATSLARVFMRGGTVVFEGLERGFTRGARSVGDLVERLFQRLRFRRFSISRRGRWLTLWGHINPPVPIATFPIETPNLDAVEAALRSFDDPALRAARGFRPNRVYRVVEPAADRGVILAEQMLREGGMLSPAATYTAHLGQTLGRSTQQTFAMGLRRMEMALEALGDLARTDPDAAARRVLQLAQEHLPGNHRQFLEFIANARAEQRTFISTFSEIQGALNRARQAPGSVVMEIPTTGRMLIRASELPDVAADLARMEILAAQRGVRLTRGVTESSGSWGRRLMRAVQESYPRNPRTGWREISWVDWNRLGFTRSMGAFWNQMDEFLMIGAQAGARVVR